MNNIIYKLKSALAGVIIISASASFCAQVGVSNQAPNGVLDLRPSSGNNTTGLVLPRAQDATQLENADGTAAVEATTAYDLSDKCMKYKGLEKWSDCLLDQQSVNTVTGSILNVGNDLKVLKASAGNWFTMAIGKNDQALYVSGYGTSYRTGTGRVQLIRSFSLVKADAVMTDVSAGFEHGLATDSNGYVYGWGNNTYGRIGNGISTGTYTPVPTKLPNWDPTTGLGKAIRVESGQYNSLILSEDGKVYSMGYYPSNLLGFTGTANVAVPTAIPTLNSVATSDKFLDISLSINSAGAVTESGKVYVWGTNGYGQLGTGNTTTTATPLLISFPASDPIGKIAIGDFNSAAISKDKKKLYTWGRNTSNGIGGTGNTLIPTLINIVGFDPTSDIIYSVAVDRMYDGAIIVSTSSGIYVAGNNAYGRLGTGNNSNVASLTKIRTTQMYTGTVITDISLGYFQSVLVSGVNADPQESDKSFSAYGCGGLQGYRELGAVNASGSAYVPTLITY